MPVIPVVNSRLSMRFCSSPYRQPSVCTKQPLSSSCVVRCKAWTGFRSFHLLDVDSSGRASRSSVVGNHRSRWGHDRTAPSKTHSTASALLLTFPADLVVSSPILSRKVAPDWPCDSAALCKRTSQPNGRDLVSCCGIPVKRHSSNEQRRFSEMISTEYRI